MEHRQDERTEQRVIESASATTSPDNAKSGPFAYIVTGITLGVMLILGLGVAGCASLAINVAAQAYDDGGAGSNDSSDNGFGPLGIDPDLEELLRQYDPSYEGQETGDGSNGRGSSRINVDDALDLDLAPYNETIGDLVRANSYAGANDQVREFVRNVVNTDRDYSGQVARALDAAALDEGARAEKISSALALCDEARQALGGLELPAWEGDSNGEAKDMLGTAKEAATRRWECMRAEIELFDTTGSIRTQEIWDRDDDVVEATEQAAEDFEEAMALSANA